MPGSDVISDGSPVRARPTACKNVISENALPKGDHRSGRPLQSVRELQRPGAAHIRRKAFDTLKIADFFLRGGRFFLIENKDNGNCLRYKKITFRSLDREPKLDVRITQWLSSTLEGESS